MDCEHVFFSSHAIKRMFERKISRDDVLEIIHNGEVIADYPDDQPYPSSLLLAFVGDRALHLVLAVDHSTNACYVITTYDPDPSLWEPNFKRRRKQ